MVGFYLAEDHPEIGRCVGTGNQHVAHCGDFGRTQAVGIFSVFIFGPRSVNGAPLGIVYHVVGDVCPGIGFQQRIPFEVGGVEVAYDGDARTVVVDERAF